MKPYRTIAKAINYITEHQREQPDLEKIARAAGVSPFHLQRLFAAWAGVSPKKFLQYISLERAKEVLESSAGSVTKASYRTGLSGTGRLHDLFVTIEGMTPGEYKNGGAGLIIFYSFHEGIFGSYLVAATQKGICRIIFYDGKKAEACQDLQASWPRARLVKKVVPLHESVVNFFNRPKRVSSARVQLHLKGTPFQLKIWEALLRIPEGKLVSYSAIARVVGKPSAQRAVGTAVGDNPVAYLIPCHRVIKNNGEIGKYHWGAPRKASMIAFEAAGGRKIDTMRLQKIS
jgi:AraC family transcriptional regulator of adaptative response/methylated-DNA-[protein]-cysteine methyltransferase